MFKRIRQIPAPIKASAAFFLANLISKGIAYITTPIYTRLLTSQEYGVVSVFLTWFEIIGIFAMFGLGNGVFNNGMVDYPKERNEFSYSLLIMSNLITIVIFAFVMGLYPELVSFIKLDMPLILLMFTVFTVKPAYTFWISKQRYEYKYKATFLCSILIALISPI